MATVGKFHSGIDEGTAAESRVLEPLLQSGEKSLQTILALADMAFNRFAEHFFHLLLSILQHCKNQIVFRLEVVIKAHLSHARFSNDAIDPYGAYPMLVE